MIATSYVLLLIVLILANYRKFGRTHLLNSGVMLSKAKHLCFVSELSDPLKSEILRFAQNDN